MNMKKKYQKESSYPLIIFRDKNGIELKRIDTSIINQINSVDDLEIILESIITSKTTLNSHY